MTIHRQKMTIGFSGLLAATAVVGCGTFSIPQNDTSSAPPQKPVHTNKAGVPQAPYRRENVQNVIMAYTSWDQPNASFGTNGTVILGKNGNDWMPVSLVETTMADAGIPSTFQHGMLNFQVSNSIVVDSTHFPSHRVNVPEHRIGISINDKLVASVPVLKPGKTSPSYLPIQSLIHILSPIHVKSIWKFDTAPNAAEWDIGTPIYGVVKTVTTGASGHFSATRSGMTIVRKGDNWIPYDYIVSSLTNARAGITGNLLGDFSGMDISVPTSVPVDMNHLPHYSKPPANEVPIEINHHVVGYAFSIVPKVGPSTGYLSSAEVMAAIKRIGLTMHWNGTNGTFSEWNITEPSSKAN